MLDLDVLNYSGPAIGVQKSRFLLTTLDPKLTVGKLEFAIWPNDCLNDVELNTAPKGISPYLLLLNDEGKPVVTKDDPKPTIKGADSSYAACKVSQWLRIQN